MKRMSFFLNKGMLNMFQYLITIIMTLFLVGCSEFNAVKSPSVEITADTSADMCRIELSAGRYGIIRYTTDGSIPQFRSALYEEALSLPVGTTLRTASFCPGGRRSQIVTVTVERPVDTSVIIQNGEYCPAPADSESSK